MSTNSTTGKATKRSLRSATFADDLRTQEREHIEAVVSAIRERTVESGRRVGRAANLLERMYDTLPDDVAERRSASHSAALHAAAAVAS